MLAIKNSLALLTASLLLGITNQSARAFSLSFGPKVTTYYNPTQPYVIDSKTTSTTFLQPTTVAPIKLGGTTEFLRMLNFENDPRWLGWNFISSDKNLYGNFEIENYYACGAQTNCGKEKQV